MQQVISFFNISAKRNFVLKKYLNRPFVKLCETQWVEMLDSVLQFKSSLTEIMKALTKVSNWEDTVSASKAKTLILSLCNCEFIISIFSLSSVLYIIYHTSKTLQGKSNDILSASNVVQDIVIVLEKNRFDCDIVFKNIYSECKSIMDQLDVELKLPRLNINQKNRPNPSNIDNCEDYYRIEIFIPLLDRIIEDLKRRFQGQDNQTLIQTLTYFIPKNLSIWSQNINSTNIVYAIKTSYPFLNEINDVPLKLEIDLWK
uniref:Repressor of the inhibitor of the protein kinase n=1 Tax=Sipha flava TaxID=143950 RepID=A0A2S2QY46_9HEMI